MNLSNGRCHLCKESNIQEDLQHLFFKCIISNRFISNITILINTLNVGTVNLNEKNIIICYNIYIHALYSLVNYLLITDRIVKILALSIASLQLVVRKIFSSDFKVFFHILQSTF
jgi:hypothetical protein